MPAGPQSRSPGCTGPGSSTTCVLVECHPIQQASRPWLLIPHLRQHVRRAGRGAAARRLCHGPARAAAHCKGPQQGGPGQGGPTSPGCSRPGTHPHEQAVRGAPRRVCERLEDVHKHIGTLGNLACLESSATAGFQNLAACPAAGNVCPRAPTPQCAMLRHNPAVHGARQCCAGTL